MTRGCVAAFALSAVFAATHAHAQVCATPGGAGGGTFWNGASDNGSGVVAITTAVAGVTLNGGAQGLTKYRARATRRRHQRRRRHHSQVIAPDDDTPGSDVGRTCKADILVTKTNTPGVNGNVDQAADTVISGASVPYSIVATNNGSKPANNAVITDPVPTNLNCPTATCAAAGGAVCPAATGAALVAALQGAGATIPTLPSGGSVTVTLNCTVP